MELRRVEYGSDGYRDCLELRRIVLRKPLGLQWSEADLAREESEWHYGLWNGEEVMASVSVRPLGEGLVRVRQMAVDPGRQRSGMGSVLLGGVLEELKDKGVTEVILHAREEAAGFYERFGFAREGDSFEEVGLPHWKMRRALP